MLLELLTIEGFNCLDGTKSLMRAAISLFIEALEGAVSFMYEIDE